jgi:hypothetical protein
MRRLGRAAFAGGVTGWVLLLAALYAGGIDPPPEHTSTLRTLVGFGFLIEMLTVLMGLVAIIVGPHRLAALFGLVFAAAYFLYFTGLIFVFFV